MNNKVTVATFETKRPAEPLQQRLNGEGIHSEIDDESRIQTLFWTSHAHGGIKLRVNKADFERARDLIRQWDEKDGALREAIRCPKCRSSRVQYPQFTRKFMIPSLVALFADLGVFKKMFFCQECQHTWIPARILEQPRVRAGAPAAR